MSKARRSADLSARAIRSSRVALWLIVAILYDGILTRVWAFPSLRDYVRGVDLLLFGLVAKTCVDAIRLKFAVCRLQAALRRIPETLDSTFLRMLFRIARGRDPVTGEGHPSPTQEKPTNP